MPKEQPLITSFLKKDGNTPPPRFNLPGPIVRSIARQVREEKGKRNQVKWEKEELIEIGRRMSVATNLAAGIRVWNQGEGNMQLSFIEKGTVCRQSSEKLEDLPTFQKQMKKRS